MRTSIRLSLLCGALACASVHPLPAHASSFGDNLSFLFATGPLSSDPDDYERNYRPNFTANGTFHDYSGVFEYAADASHLYFVVEPGHAGQRLNGLLRTFRSTVSQSAI